MKASNALIIDDHENVLEEIAMRLDSLGHSYQKAKSQEEAEHLIDNATHYFDYILLDVEIPCKYQSPPKQQYGKNLLVKIRQKTGYEKTPVIVITAYGNDSPHLAVEMLKLGATDFINKPFEDDSRNSLEKKIGEAIQGTGAASSGHSKTKPFKGGKLVFYQDRVELVIGSKEIRVSGDRSDATILRILALLKVKHDRKDKQAYTGKLIAEKLSLPRADAHVRESIREFRELCSTRLFAEGLECGIYDIVANNGSRGYEFKDWIEACSGSDEEPASSINLSQGQKGILRILHGHGGMTRKKIADKLGLPVETFKDDLQWLIDHKQATRAGNGASATYSAIDAASNHPL